MLCGTLGSLKKSVVTRYIPPPLPRALFRAIGSKAGNTEATINDTWRAVAPLPGMSRPVRPRIGVSLLEAD